MPCLSKKILFGLSGLLLVPACGKHDKSDQPGNSVVALTGHTDKDLIGGWQSACLPEGQGSRRLNYRFNARGLELVEATDLVHANCENPSLVTTYRLNLQAGVWSPDQPMTRGIQAELKQVTTRTESEQLTRFFNRDSQCGLGDWVTGQERDITNLACLGVDTHHDLAFGLTYVTAFQLWIVHHGNEMALSAASAGNAYKTALDRLFLPNSRVTVDDGRDVGLKFWNNEVPDNYKRVVTATLDLRDHDLPFKDGTGSFYPKQYATQQNPWKMNAKLESGLMTFTMEVPVATAAKTFTVRDGNLVTADHTWFFFRFDEAAGTLTFKHGDEVVASLPVSSPKLEVPAGSSVDTEAPQFEFLDAPLSVSRAEDVFFRVKASDDLSGFLLLQLIVEFEGGLKAWYSANEMVYEGKGIYRARFSFKMSDPKYKVVRVINMVAMDRVGNVTEDRTIDVRVTD